MPGAAVVTSAAAFEPAALPAPPMAGSVVSGTAPGQSGPVQPAPGQLAAGSTALRNDTATKIERGESPASAVGATNAITQSHGDEQRDRFVSQAGEGRRQRKPLALMLGGGAAAVVVLIVAIVALRGGGSESKSSASKQHRGGDRSGESGKGEGEGGGDDVAGHNDPRSVGDSTRSGSNMRIDDQGRRVAGNGAEDGASGRAGTAGAGPGTAGAGNASVGTGAGTEVTSPPVDVEPKAATPAPTPTPTVPPKKTLGGKKVVLEYDSAAPKKIPDKVPAPPKGDDSAAVGAARITYFNGNRKLFAGDADSAIQLYRQALAMYPGYVASYRGLGLAYAQKGDKANALKALRTYISAVPAAKDVALIKKRIATLQK